MINRFNTILSKIPTAFLEEIHKSILRFICNLKTLRVQTSLKITKLEVTQLFQNYHKAKLIKVAQYWHEDRPVEQNKDVRINLCIWSNDVPQGVSTTQWGKGSPLNYAERRPRWWSRRMWSSSSPTDTPKIHLHVEQVSQNTY